LTNNGGCNVNALCTNTIGSFNCNCKTGYSGNGWNCSGMNFFKTKSKKKKNHSNIWNDLIWLNVDINECSTNNGGCDENAICSNTIGSFSCNCKPEYSGDGFTCYGNLLFWDILFK